MGLATSDHYAWNILVAAAQLTVTQMRPWGRGYISQTFREVYWKKIRLRGYCDVDSLSVLDVQRLPACQLVHVHCGVFILPGRICPT